MAIYEVETLTFRYEKNSPPANDDISFTIAEGEIFGLLGANGAGKTTLVKQMVSLLKSSSGTIRLMGKALGDNQLHTARYVSYMPQSGEALNNLTVAETLYFTAHLRGLSRHDAQQARDYWLDRLELGNIRDKVAMRLSGGQRRLTLIATTLIANRPVLIFDEPTNDLDPQRRRQIWDLLRSVQREHGTTMMLVTHNVVEAERMIERVGIVKDGRLIAVGRPGQLKKQLHQQLHLSIRFTPNQPPTLPDGAVPHDADDNQWQLLIERDHAPQYLEALNSQAQVEDYTLSTPTLEDLYIALMNGD